MPAEPHVRIKPRYSEAGDHTGTAILIEYRGEHYLTNLCEAVSDSPAMRGYHAQLFRQRHGVK